MIAVRIGLAHPGFALRVDLELPAHGVTAVSGPSASGKTTLLRCLAGLEPAALGRIEFEGQTWQDSPRGIFLPAHRRALGYVFQEARLFAHRNVRANLAYGWDRTPVAQRRIGWDQAVGLLDVGPLLDRDAQGLSGGERQRIAIARALLASPRLLLMDEPLASLDAARRREILPLLERVHRELDIPVIYVSHQAEELARLADHMVLLDRGTVAASGPLAQLLARTDLPMAQDDDAGVVIEARAAAHDQQYQLTRLEFAGGAIFVGRDDLVTGQTVRLHVQARDVSLTLSPHGDSSILNRFSATVVQIAPAANPANVIVRLDAGGTALLARITRQSRDQLRLEAGSAVWVQVKAAALMH